MPRWVAFSIASTLLMAAGSENAYFDGYVWDFETTPAWYLDAWSSTGVDDDFFGPGKVLGYFGDGTLDFFAMDAVSLDALFANTVYLSFDLVVFLPDQIHLQIVGNGETLLDATFSNVPGVDQSYPSAPSPAGTGSSAFVPPLASAYSLAFSFGFPAAARGDDCCADVDLTFSADVAGTSGQWAIDDFVISSTPIPEPSTGILTGLGLVLLAARRRSRAPATR